jgi:hypothetical protein
VSPVSRPENGAEGGCHYAVSRRILASTFGGGVIGNTPGSGPVIEGSSPSPRARQTSVCPTAPSSRGLGRRPLKAVAWVQIPSGLREHLWCSLGVALQLLACFAVVGFRLSWAACRMLTGLRQVWVQFPSGLREHLWCSLGVALQLLVRFAVVGLRYHLESAAYRSTRSRRRCAGTIIRPYVPLGAV